MRIFKVKAFERWAQRERIGDGVLRQAIDELSSGLVDAQLGAHLFKKRIPASSRGKRGGARTIIAFATSHSSFFIYGFLKNEKENLEPGELRALKQYAASLLGLSETQVRQLITRGELFEVK